MHTYLFFNLAFIVKIVLRTFPVKFLLACAKWQIISITKLQTMASVDSECIKAANIGSKCIKVSTYYLADKQDFDVSSEGPSAGISRGDQGKACVLLYK